MGDRALLTRRHSRSDFFVVWHCHVGDASARTRGVRRVCVVCAAALGAAGSYLTISARYTTRWQGRSARLSWIFKVIEGLMLREGPSREVP